jgi:hypothetical protein
MGGIMTDRELMQQAYAVPLHEQLASVPANARLVIDDPDRMSTRFIPVGRMCHEAASALRERLAQPAQQSLEDELTEQARLLGMGAERELSQMSRITELEKALRLALEALDLAKSSHGVLLLSDPPQEAWRVRDVEGRIREAIITAKQALGEA